MTVELKSFPSHLHCCMSEAKMDAPLSLAVLLMKEMVTFCKQESDSHGRRLLIQWTR